MVFLLLPFFGFSDFTNKYSLFLVIGGLIGISLFYFVEKRAAFPLINLDLFKIKRFTFGNITAFINYGAFVSVGFILTLYLQYLKGYSPITAGLIVTVQSIMMILVSPFTGRLSDKIDPGNVSTVGMVLTTIGVALMTLINFDNALYLGGFSLIIFGSGIGLFYSSNTKLVMSAVDKKYFGVASATLSDMRSMGQIFGRHSDDYYFHYFRKCTDYTFQLSRTNFKPENFISCYCCFKRSWSFHVII